MASRREGPALPLRASLRAASQVGVDLSSDSAANIRLLQDLKRLVHNKRRQLPDQRVDDYVINYPDEPTHQLVNTCYAADDPPLGLMEAPGLSSKALPLRTTHKSVAATGSQLCVAAKAPALPAAPAVGFQMGDPSAVQTMMQMLQPLMGMMQFFQNMHNGGDGSSGQATGGLSNLQVFTPPTHSRRLSYQNQNNDAARSPPADESQQETPPPQSVLALPDLPPTLSPEEQAKLVADATKERQEAKAAEPKAGAKAKAKAKAKGKAKAKSQTATKAAPKATVKAAAKAKGKAKAKVKPEDRKVYSKDDERPPRPELGDPTTWYRSGKIHINQGCFRVFLRVTDRCDRKIRILPGQEQECWEKALSLIDERLASGDAAEDAN